MFLKMSDLLLWCSMRCLVLIFDLIHLDRGQWCDIDGIFWMKGEGNHPMDRRKKMKKMKK